MKKAVESQSIVLVIDDDVHVRDALRFLFESVGLQVLAFSSVSEFLRGSRPEAPSCLVLDIRLPGASGLDLQDELAQENVPIPIIFITAHGDIPMSVKAMKAGAVEFLTKPVREQDILDAVRVAIERDCARRAQENEISALRVRFQSLTEREKEIIAWVTTGLMNKQTANRVGVSEPTVKSHRHNAMKKLGARSLVDLVRMVNLLGGVEKR